MFQLRPYQQQTADKAVQFLLNPFGDHGLIVCPTGGGKSLILANIISRLPEPAIVFQPSKEILVQNKAKLEAYGYQPAVFSASLDRREVGQITLATIGSVRTKPELFQHVRYVLIDECHGVNAKNETSMFMQFLNSIEARVLGLTATPYRLVTDGFGGSILKFLTRTRPRVFSRVIHVVQNGELFDQGYLCPLEYKVVKTGFRRDKLKLNSTGADYTDESVKRHFRELNFQDQIVRCVERLNELGRRGVLVFTRFVEEAQYVADHIPGAAIVTAETPSAERDRIISQFRSGIIPCVANVGVLTLGFDYPELANVVLARPTMSLALYYQMVGRCVRVHPAKASAFVIDMVGLSEQFGRVEHLTLKAGPHETWAVWNLGRQLTNVYFGNPRPKPSWLKPKSDGPRWFEHDFRR